ncbi:MAG: SDR family oxidoreductase [Acidobacteria bacterium]|nr:SDR family oxidoreductase [Acidobacteriota bacterium]
MNLALAGQVVVVTGGASGIGRGIAEGFAAEGARVAIWDIAANTAEVAAEIPGAFGCVVDVTQPNSIAAALAATGDADHLVHSAAVGSRKFGFPFTNLTPEDWPRVLTVNIVGMVNVAHALAPGMIARKRGTMTFIASIAGQIGSQTDPPYSASKAANINFAQCLAKDLAPHGVRVNTVCPGMVKTPLNRGIWQAWHDRQAPEDRLDFETWGHEKIRKSTPLGTWQTAADIANMTVFLASNRAGQVTGQTINVDGGFVMHW